MVIFELKPNNRNAPADEILADIQKIAAKAESGRLTKEKYRELGGRFGSSTIARRFGSWTNALKQAELAISRHYDVSREDLIKDILDVSSRLNLETLPCTTYYKYGIFSERLVKRHFTSWSDALQAAGLRQSPAFHARATDEELFSDIENLWRKLGRQPKSTEVGKPNTRFSKGAFENRFGGWRLALEAFVKAVSVETGSISSVPENASDFNVSETPEKSFCRRRNPGWRLRYLVLKRDNFRCVLCGLSPATNPGTILVLDHIIPWSAGGETEFKNLRTLCESCNGGKGDLIETE